MALEYIDELAEQWRDEADRYERDDARVPAHRLLRRLADDLERGRTEWRDELLCLKDAASEIRYSYSWLQQAVADGTIPNHGRSGPPLVRRGDLNAYLSGDPVKHPGSPECEEQATSISPNEGTSDEDDVEAGPRPRFCDRPRRTV